VDRISYLIDMTISNVSDPEEIARRYREYHEYLESVRDRLPPSVYDFATAPWHFDPTDPMCPHDSWVEWATVREPFSGDRSEKRALEIEVRLFGAWHDGHLILKYGGVETYSLAGPGSFQQMPTASVGHGDWLVDEIRLSE